MLWLKENNIISRNIIEGDKIKLNNLKDKLYDKERYLLFESEIGRGLAPNSFFTMYKYIGFDCLRGAHSAYSAYVKKVYINPTPESLKVVLKALEDVETENVELDLMKIFGGDLRAIDLIDSLQKKMALDETMEIISRCWPDFYCFVAEVLKNINLRKIAEYDVSDLECFFETYDDKNPLKAVEVLSRVPIAANNNKVLALARKITDNK